jgi:hypothetical protein
VLKRVARISISTRLGLRLRISSRVTKPSNRVGWVEERHEVKPALNPMISAGGQWRYLVCCSEQGRELTSIVLSGFAVAQPNLRTELVL